MKQEKKFTTAGTQGKAVPLLSGSLHDKKNLGTAYSLSVVRRGYLDYLMHKGFCKEYESWPKENQLNYEIGRALATQNKKYRLNIAWPQSVQYPKDLDKCFRLIETDRVFDYSQYNPETIEKVEIY